MDNNQPANPIGAEALREAVHRLSVAAAKLNVATDGMLRLRAEREEVLSSLKALAALSQPVAAPQPETAGGWQDIATAPKDVTFLAWFPDYGGRVDFCHWQDFGPPSTAPIGWRDAFINVYPEGHELAPTHWMPLPAAPGSIPAQPEGGAVAKRQSELTERFRDAVANVPYIIERVAGGQQFNAYESADDEDEEVEDEDREYRLCIGPISNARFIADVEGHGRAKILEAALKLASHVAFAALQPEKTHDQ